MLRSDWSIRLPLIELFIQRLSVKDMYTEEADIRLRKKRVKGTNVQELNTSFGDCNCLLFTRNGATMPSGVTGVKGERQGHVRPRFELKSAS